MPTATLPETQQTAEAVPLLLAPKAAARFLGVSRGGFWEFQKHPGFPQKVALPGHEPWYYRRSDLEAWVASLPTAARPEPVGERSA